MSGVRLPSVWGGALVATILVQLLMPSTAPCQEARPSEFDLQILPGITRPKLQVDLFPPSPGIVQELRVVEGDRVGRGDVLAVLDDRVARAMVATAEAAADVSGRLEFARSELDFARRHFRRLDAVENARGVSQHEIDTGRANMEKAEANLKLALHEERLAETKLQLERARLETHRLRAPFSGVVVKLQVSEGQKLLENTVVIELANLSTLVTELYLPVSMYGQVEVGRTYRLRAETPVDGDIEAVLASSEPVVDAGTQTFRCVFEIDNAHDGFPAGFVVRFADSTTVARSWPWATSTKDGTDKSQTR